MVRVPGRWYTVYITGNGYGGNNTFLRTSDEKMQAFVLKIVSYYHAVEQRWKVEQQWKVGYEYNVTVLELWLEIIGNPNAGPAQIEDIVALTHSPEVVVGSAWDEVMLQMEQWRKQRLSNRDDRAGSIRRIR